MCNRHILHCQTRISIPQMNRKTLETMLVVTIMLIIPLLFIYYRPQPEPPPTITKTINLIDQTGTKNQTWTYTGIPISINYPDPKGIGTVVNVKGEQIFINDQPIYIPIGWYLQIQEPTKQ